MPNHFGVARTTTLWSFFGTATAGDPRMEGGLTESVAFPILGMRGATGSPNEERDRWQSVQRLERSHHTSVGFPEHFPHQSLPCVSG